MYKDTLASNLDYVQPLIENKVSSICSELSVSNEIEFTSKVDFPCENSVYSNSSVSKPYLCHSNECNLPSCNLDSSIPLEVDSAKSLSSLNKQNSNPVLSQEVPPSFAGSFSNVDTAVDVLQESVETSIAHSVLPSHNTVSLNLDNHSKMPNKFLLSNP